jgi:hypothetical protein
MDILVASVDTRKLPKKIGNMPFFLFSQGEVSTNVLTSVSIFLKL